METPPTPSLFLTFFPLIFMGVLFALAFIPLAMRKGVHVILVLICMPLPLLNLVFLGWLLSKEDVELKSLREKVASLEKALKDKGLI